MNPKFKSNVFLNSLNTAISISDEATNLIEFKIWLTKIKSKSLSYLTYYLIPNTTLVLISILFFFMVYL